MTNLVRPRCWTRFGIRTILILMAIVAVPLAWKVNRVRSQRRAVEVIKASGGEVIRQDANSGSAVPNWMRQYLGDDFFADVVEVEIEVHHVLEYEDNDVYCLRSIDAFRALPDLPALERVVFGEMVVSDEALDHLRKCSTLKIVVVRVHEGFDVHGDYGSPQDASESNLKLAHNRLNRVRLALPRCEVKYQAKRWPYPLE